MVSTDRVGSPERVKILRNSLGLTQTELAERLGVTYVTISRWENGQARPNRLAIKALTSLVASSSRGTAEIRVPEKIATYTSQSQSLLTDFRGNPELVRLFVEGERLRYGHPSSLIFWPTVSPGPPQRKKTRAGRVGRSGMRKLPPAAARSS